MAAPLLWFPVYPKGFVAVDGHEPWSGPNVLALVACFGAFAAARRLIVPLAALLGRRFGAALHGPKWLAPGGAGAAVDWARFGAETYYASVHMGLCAYALLAPALRADLLGCLAYDSGMWALQQPAMNRALRSYLISQFGFATESSCALVLSALRGGDAHRDRAMLMHHTAAMILLAVMWRCHFVRVGALVNFIHDISDLPIDGIRLSQAVGWNSALCAPRVLARAERARLPPARHRCGWRSLALRSAQSLRLLLRIAACCCPPAIAVGGTDLRCAVRGH